MKTTFRFDSPRITGTPLAAPPNPRFGEDEAPRKSRLAAFVDGLICGLLVLCLGGLLIYVAGSLALFLWHRIF
ncbi:MAG: hypothetical protein JWN89_712 [Parcubacteria group bacterium]|nr:hypothetical protein [Parcubacteria group bacterium]